MFGTLCIAFTYGHRDSLVEKFIFLISTNLHTIVLGILLHSLW